VGYVMPWVEMQAVDDADRPLKAGLEGRIRMRGHNCVSGYVGNPPDSDHYFRGGWFYPGDIGTVTDDRLLIIAGRENAVINLGGNKVNPEKIEAALMSCPGIKDAAAFGYPNAIGVEEIWAVVVTDVELNLASVRADCARQLHDEFVPRYIVRVAGIARNVMGRIERSQLRDLVAKK
jgi:2,3-dihydroxybenzoate-AMP ligase